ncbi:hypothetical protein IAR55_004572 [Kwoniella newhampshirensis]|uniref:Phytase-like domain-containing protein n=1 Tax=Kwoniella newhampshirensis TaxID=1651941 RepID=A0AAW0YXJ5_9TREE
MRFSFLTLSSLLLVAPCITATPIKNRSTHKVDARHVIQGRQFGHGSTVEYGSTLATSSVYLEGSDDLTLYTSSNFTTIIVEAPVASSFATLIAAWGGQPIYNFGSGYVLGVPNRIYANWMFPEVSADELPLRVCTYVYPEPQGVFRNVTTPSRDNFNPDSFATELGLQDAVAEFCLGVGSAVPSSTVVRATSILGVSAGSVSPTTTVISLSSSSLVVAVPPVQTPTAASSAAVGTIASPSVLSSSLSTDASVPSSRSGLSATSSPGSSRTPGSPISSAHLASSQPLSTALHSTASMSPASSVVVVPSTTGGSWLLSSSRSIPSVPVSTIVRSSLVTSSRKHISTSISTSSSSRFSATSTKDSASFTSSPNTTATAPSRAPTNGTSVTISVRPSNTSVVIPSATANATSSKVGPNPAYQTNVTFAGKTYINKGLVGFGAIPGDALDSFGETIGGIGSAIALQSFEKTADTYTGVLMVQPDRGHNTATTTDFIARHHLVSFTLNPYYDSSKLEYQNAKSTFQLSYDSTVRYFETDGTPTTGLDALAARNSTPPEPIANSTYNHISTDAEGLVLNRDGSIWVSDEYGPYIWKYSADGKLLSTVVPPKAVLPYRNGSLFFSADSAEGPETGRQPNQGFEGLTASPDGKTLYALLQTGTEQDLDENDEGRYTRLFIYDVSDTPTLTNAYVVQLPVTNGKGKALGTSDFIYVSEDTFMMLSRDGKGNGNDDPDSKHKDFLLFNLDGATDIVKTDYTMGVVPVSPKGKLVSDIKAIIPTEFISIIDDTQLARFGLHNDGAYDVSLINGKWESSALASIQDPEYPDDYFLFSFSDNDFITTHGFEAGAPYSDKFGHTLDNQALVWRVTLP